MNLITVMKLLLIKVGLGVMLGLAFVFYAGSKYSGFTAIPFVDFISFLFLFLTASLFISILLIPIFDFPLLYLDSHRLRIYKGFFQTALHALYGCLFSAIINIASIAVLFIGVSLLRNLL